jgi:hypothetical protein
MSISRPFAYNTGSPIAGTEQIGNLAIGFPTEGFSSTGLAWWNGPDEQLGYVVAQSVPDNSQPTPIEGVFASVGFFRSSELTESSFVDLANTLAAGADSWAPNQGAQAKIWLNNNGYWTSFEGSIAPSNTPTPSMTPTLTPTPTVTSTSTPTPTPTNTPTIPSQDINQTGLVLYTNMSNSSSYPGTGTSVFDLSPNGYTGTIINSENVSYVGGSTKSLQFNNAISSSPYIDWGLGASLVRSASEITVCVFLRQISIPHGNTGFRWSALINLDFCSGANRKFSFYMYNTSNNVNVAPNIALDFFDGVGGGVGFTLSSANWINQDLYIVASCKSGTNNAKAYINGVLQSPTKNGLVVNPTPSGANSNLMTGRGPGSCFDGYIGESNLYSIHIYDRTLTDAEVLSNYNILKTQFNIA